MDKFMENLKRWWGWITLGAAIFTTITGLSLKIIYAIEQQDKLIIETQTLARKSLIWNSDYPLIERAEECDEYLADGNNSVTKKLCNYIIEKEESIGDSFERNNTEDSKTNRPEDYSDLNGDYSSGLRFSYG